MKLKIFTLLLISMFVAMVSAQKPEATIVKTNVIPLIDGEIDDVWDNANVYPIDKPFQEEEPTVFNSTWQALWSDDLDPDIAGVYILILVDDDEYFPFYDPEGGANSWEYDKIEIYFDCNTGDLDDDGGPAPPEEGHYQYAVEYNAEKISGGEQDGNAAADPDDILYSHLVVDPNVIAEYFIPFRILLDKDDGPVDQTEGIGFDITIIDRERGDPGRKRAVWANIGGIDESWVNMNDCGIIHLEGASEKVYITSFSLGGDREITKNNEKLEIIPMIEPDTATNKTLGWSVENITGRATVDKGVVTPILNGTVKIMAETKDGSFFFDTIEVEISGQLISEPELNLIKNGYFEELNDDGGLDNPIPRWGTSGFENDPYVTDGYAVLDPSPGGTAPWSTSFSQTDLGCNKTDGYTLSFVGKAEQPREIIVGFEDNNNDVDGDGTIDYNRYGTSESEYAMGPGDYWWQSGPDQNPPQVWTGNSYWTIPLTTEWTKFVMDVSFEHMDDGGNPTNEQFEFHLGLSDTAVYIDSVVLINDNDKAYIDVYNPVTEITVSADGDPVVHLGSTLQMLADVQPGDADYTDVYWSVESGTGYAHIDDAGVLTGDSVGKVTVRADASDDSKVYDEMEITVTWAEGIEQHRVNTLKLYPNPAVSELNIVLTEVNSTVGIYNSVGQKIEEVIVSGTEYRLDVSSYERGIYFVRSGNLVAKFIK